MALLIAIGSLTAGVIIGIVATYRFSNTSPVKVRQLEQQIEDLQQTHKAYRENVSNHFSTTAELVQQMTESYKDVYRHLASGAQTLCDHEIADKMLPAGERDKLFQEDDEDKTDEPAPDTNSSGQQPEAPRDYADRESGGGTLSEEYGLGKSGATTESDATSTAGPADSGNDDSEPTDSHNRDSKADEQEQSSRNAGSDEAADDTTSTTETSAWQPSTGTGEDRREDERDEDPLAAYRKPATEDAEAGQTDGDTRTEDSLKTDSDSLEDEKERSQKG